MGKRFDHRGHREHGGKKKGNENNGEEIAE
jgi:hypothetical protein